ncbi:MAG: threonine/serine exporter family protein [Rhodanobacter sp.]|jgi:uncharacterized membrane protein YjjP (DUF1212 family)|nr:threonine/serine exporter family protein [Rhodanobacter sp.]
MSGNNLPVAASENASLKARIGFIVELARRLHEYGTTAPRLEDVINLVSARVGLACHVLSTPTSVVMSFSDRDRGDDLAEITQVVRLPPGEVNLNRLCQVDEIADQVIDGRIDFATGRSRLHAIGLVPRSRAYKAALVVSYGVSAGSVAVILHTGWAGVATAALNGFLIGLIHLACDKRPNLTLATEALCALLATLLATAVAVCIVPLAVRSVVIASLVVLLPGMTLTTAVRELSSQHLVSGAARMMGALATLLKLAFGALTAAQLCALFGWVPGGTVEASVPRWTEWIAVLAGAGAFAVSFGSPRRYAPAVVAAVVLGYVCARVGGIYATPTFGVFAGGLVIGAASNAFARVMHCPGALIREPGIILLVPGSVGFRTLNLVFESDVLLGIDSAVVLVTLLAAIVAGLLFGDLLMPARRTL